MQDGIIQPLSIHEPPIPFVLRPGIDERPPEYSGRLLWVGRKSRAPAICCYIPGIVVRRRVGMWELLANAVDYRTNGRIER